MTQASQNRVFRDINPGDSIFFWPVSAAAGITIDKNITFPVSNVAGDYFTAVRDGKIPGHSLDSVVARNPSVTSGFEDCWGEGGFIVPPESAETWEMVFDNANDTLGGAGARTLLVLSLSGLGVEQFQVVEANGGTVQLTGTHFRPRLAVVLTSGDAGADSSNIGTIKIQAVGSGLVRNVILPDVGISHDGYYTMPSNKRGQVLTTWIIFPKNGTGFYRNRVRTGATADEAWISPSWLPVGQNLVDFSFQSRLPFPPGTELKLQLSADSGQQDSTVIFEVLIMDEGF
jgi:hypothetical protein